MQTEKKTAPSAEPGAPRKCPECNGRGWVDNRCLTPDHAHRCSYCNGKGFDAGGNECYACKGTGLLEVRQVDKNPCPLCGGAGVYPVPPSMVAWDFAYKPGVKR
jgi:DnaJ-class molecular chaperone